MNLTHKIEKLLSKKGLRSAASHLFRRWQTVRATLAGNAVNAPFPLTPENLLASFDGAEFQRIQKQHGVTEPTHSNRKYISFPLPWLDKNIRRIQAVGLDYGARRNVLDLGCGAGYFLYIAQLLGHRAIGLDIDNEPIFRKMTSLLKVDRRVCGVQAFVALPEFGCKFDIVTAHLICFNGHDTEQVWGVKEWSFFFNDLSRHLQPDAKIDFQLNPEPGNVFLTDELHSYFRNRLKAVISPSRRHLFLEHRRFRAA